MFKNIFIFTLILAAAILRIADILPYNFTPIAAIALFGGAMFDNRSLAFLAPLSIMFISDLFIGFHDTMFAVYAGFLSIVLIGQMIRKNTNMLTAMGGALLGSVLFFLITNAAVWYGSPYYSQDLSGLLNSYSLGLPFFRGTLVGNMLFTALFFKTFSLAEKRFPIALESQLV